MNDSVPAAPDSSGRGPIAIPLRGSLLALAFVLAAAATAGLVAAALPVGTVGDAADALLVVAFLLPVGGGLLIIAASETRLTAVCGPLLLSALGVGAFAYVLALDLGYDGYYGDGARYIDHGPIGPGTMSVLAALAGAAVLIGLRKRRLGARATGSLLWLYLPVAFFLHTGH